jgi:hypothetical protein
VQAILRASDHFRSRGLRPALVENGWLRAIRPISYAQHFGEVGEVAGRVLVEAGTASGREPTATIELSSDLATFLREAGLSLDAEDEAPFAMRLLHFRRTFVEKLFAIHGKVELLKRDGRPVGSYARHYYDLAQLLLQPLPSELLCAAGHELRAQRRAVSDQRARRDSRPKLRNAVPGPVCRSLSTMTRSALALRAGEGPPVAPDSPAWSSPSRLTILRRRSRGRRS